MRVLWLCNIMPSLVRQHSNEKTGDGLWIDHVLQEMVKQEDIEIKVLCPSFHELYGEIDSRISYYLFKERVPYHYYSELEEKFYLVLQKYLPQVVHIWGTEYGHTLAMMNACERLGIAHQAVISIQGLCCFVPPHHNEGIPFSVIHSSSLRDFLRFDNLCQQSKMYAKRGKLEIEALKKTKHVIGRTEWDRACCEQINPHARYHFCNETMREPFYSDVWSYEKCHKHQIFAPNWADPSKGFHYLLEAMPEVLKQYPDAIIYVTGKSFFQRSIKGRLRARAHHKYLAKIADRYGLKDKIIFTGHLSAEEMKHVFLTSNVYVLPSTVENSPNTVCEAMLLGVPCVCSAVGGLITMMNHRKEGFLYQPSALYMLAYYIKEVFRMGEGAEIMGRAAREHALETHNPEVNFQTLQSIYKEVAGK